LVLDLNWPCAIHQALLIGWRRLLRRCSAAKTSTNLKELPPVSDLSNTSNTVSAEVDSLSLILSHLIVADLSHGLSLMTSMTFPLCFPLSKIRIHFSASLESKIAEFLIDRR
jgi:hypothetical protein